MVDELDQARMTHLILQERDAEEALGEAREAVMLWVKRGRLAQSKGELELARQAKGRADQAKEQFIQARARLDSLQSQKRALRREARRPDGAQTFRAEMLVEQFRLQGISPEEQEADEIARRMGAEIELGRLRGEPVDEPPGGVAESGEGGPELDDRGTLEPDEGETGPPVTEDEIAALERELAELRAEDARDSQASNENETS